MPNANELKPGQAVEIDGTLYQIVERSHHKPGKGRAFVKMKLKSLDGGGVIERTFRPEESVNQVVIDRRDHQFLYRDSSGFHFMDNETYAQIVLTEEEVGDSASFLSEGAVAQLPVHAGKPIGVELPASVELNVAAAEPGVKGDRVSGATKPVTLETGLVVQAPLFIEEGDRVKVDTRTGTYITRVT